MFLSMGDLARIDGNRGEIDTDLQNGQDFGVFGMDKGDGRDLPRRDSGLRRNGGWESEWRLGGGVW